MAARYILAALALVFLAAGVVRRRHIQGRVWLLVATIFTLVSVWLFTRG